MQAEKRRVMERSIRFLKNEESLMTLNFRLRLRLINLQSKGGGGRRRGETRRKGQRGRRKGWRGKAERGESQKGTQGGMMQREGGGYFFGETFYFLFFVKYSKKINCPLKFCYDKLYRLGVSLFLLFIQSLSLFLSIDLSIHLSTNLFIQQSIYIASLSFSNYFSFVVSFFS